MEAKRISCAYFCGFCPCNFYFTMTEPKGFVIRRKISHNPADTEDEVNTAGGKVLHHERMLGLILYCTIASSAQQHKCNCQEQALFVALSPL